MDTPTQEAMARAIQSFDVKDPVKGVVITLKKPSVLAQYRIIEILGGERSSNQTYVMMVLPLLYVTAIDGNTVPPLTKHSEIEALIQRLDESGVEAVSTGVLEHFGQQKQPAEAKAEIKK